MIAIQCLFQSLEKFEGKIMRLDREKSCLVEVFTSELQPEEAVVLANEIKRILPNAQIIGSSVNAVIYKGEQYEDRTLIVVEQYAESSVVTKLVPYEEKSYSEIAKNMSAYWRGLSPKLLRLFVGNYYDYSHQLVDVLNEMNPEMKIVGGVSGELCNSKEKPFVFNEYEAQSMGLIFAGIYGENLSVYGRINTAHETISPEYTITGVKDRAIVEIEGQTAQSWLQRNLGFLSTKQYDSWEDIASNDPLVRFQLALQDNKRSIRFLRFDESRNEITQYFSRLKEGTKFRLSYTSPAKCVEECKETCMDIQETPLETLFCYNCLFRKLYLKNCAKWELSPFHENPISGIFLLGEFGYSEDGNALLNGSCVMSGVAEEETYMKVDMSCLSTLDEIQGENEGLLDFIIRKQGQIQSVENKMLLGDLITKEASNQKELYVDMNLELDNMLKFENDKNELEFDKICLMKIENAEVLMSYMGQASYFNQLRSMVKSLKDIQALNEEKMKISVYTMQLDAFVLASNHNLEKELFIQFIRELEYHCKVLQDKFMGTPFLLRFVVVTDQEFLLEQAYSQLQLHNKSQSRLIVGNSTEMHKIYTHEELDVINLIRYAISEDQIIPYYQGIYNNRTKCIDKYEALMRIRDRNGRILAPDYFMDIAKKYRLYLELNLKMFEAVLNDFSQVDYSVNINISAHDIASSTFIDVIHERLKTFRDPSNITFEILEDEYFTDIQALKTFIAEVRSYGAKIAIDDFGSGYSNLLEIAKIHPDYLKIDGQIIRGMYTSYENEAIVEVTTSLGQKLSIDLVAEYVESEEVQMMVDKYEILYSQGYYFSKPQPFYKILEEIND